MSKYLLALLLAGFTLFVSKAQEKSEGGEVETLLKQTNAILSIGLKDVGSIKDADQNSLAVAKAVVRDEQKGTQLNGCRLDYKTKKMPTVGKHVYLDEDEIEEVIEAIDFITDPNKIKSLSSVSYKSKSGIVLGVHISTAAKAYFIKIGEDEFKVTDTILGSLKQLLQQM